MVLPDPLIRSCRYPSKIYFDRASFRRARRRNTGFIQLRQCRSPLARDTVHHTVVIVVRVHTNSEDVIVRQRIRGADNETDRGTDEGTDGSGGGGGQCIQCPNHSSAGSPKQEKKPVTTYSGLCTPSWKRVLRDYGTLRSPIGRCSIASPAGIQFISIPEIK